MITWIVASHDRRILDHVLGPSLLPYHGFYGDEVLVINNAESITKAYAMGQSQASFKIRCYIHHDIEILDFDVLRSTIIHYTAFGGIAGVIGSKSMAMPWWHGSPLTGTVRDGRYGLFDYGGEGSPCAVVDGMLLATRHDIEWDESWPGWHGYEYDACRQFLEKGVQNWCMSNGHLLVSHNSDSPYDLAQVDGWADAMERYNAKWGDGSPA